MALSAVLQDHASPPTISFDHVPETLAAKNFRRAEKAKIVVLKNSKGTLPLQGPGDGDGIVVFGHHRRAASPASSPDVVAPSAPSAWDAIKARYPHARCRHYHHHNHINDRADHQRPAIRTPGTADPPLLASPVRLDWYNGLTPLPKHYFRTEHLADTEYELAEGRAPDGLLDASRFCTSMKFSVAAAAGQGGVYALSICGPAPGRGRSQCFINDECVFDTARGRSGSSVAAVERSGEAQRRPGRTLLRLQAGALYAFTVMSWASGGHGEEQAGRGAGVVQGCRVGLERVGDGSEEGDESDAVDEDAAAPATAIVVVDADSGHSEQERRSGFSRAHTALPRSQEELIMGVCRRYHGSDCRVVVVVLMAWEDVMGVDTSKWIDDADAVIAAWLPSPGSEFGDALVHVLSGAVCLARR